MWAKCPEKCVDWGLLLVRLGLGGFYIFVHGGPKLLAGPEVWGQVGLAMGSVGIQWNPVFWGLVAALSEFVGGICLVTGFLFRPGCLFMAITMAVAASMHLQKGDGLGVASHAIENMLMFLGLMLAGSGKYRLGSGCPSKKEGSQA